MKLLAIGLLLASAIPAQTDRLPFTPTGLLRYLVGLPPLACGGCGAGWIDQWNPVGGQDDLAWGYYSVVEGGGSGQCVLAPTCTQIQGCTANTQLTVVVLAGYDIIVGSQHYQGPFQYQTVAQVPGQLCGLFQQIYVDVYQRNPWVRLGTVAVQVGCVPCQ